jgi:hypothetical protein
LDVARSYRVDIPQLCLISKTAAHNGTCTFTQMKTSYILIMGLPLCIVLTISLLSLLRVSLFMKKMSTMSSPIFKQVRR